MHKRVTDVKTKWRRLKSAFFVDYSLLAMFSAYPASKCTSPRIYIYTHVCVGLVVIVSPRTALGLLKEEEEERRTICVGDDFGLPL